MAETIYSAVLVVRQINRLSKDPENQPVIARDAGCKASHHNPTHHIPTSVPIMNRFPIGIPLLLPSEEKGEGDDDNLSGVAGSVFSRRETV